MTSRSIVGVVLVVLIAAGVWGAWNLTRRFAPAPATPPAGEAAAPAAAEERPAPAAGLTPPVLSKAPEAAAPTQAQRMREAAAAAQAPATAPTPAAPRAPHTPTALEQLPSGTLSMARSLPEGGYVPGESLPVAVALDYTENSFPVTALAVVETLPEGWTFQGVTSTPAPAVQPQKGATGEIALAWIEPPPFPHQLTYLVGVPASEGGGTRQLTGQSQYRTKGPEEQAPSTATDIPRK